MSRQHMEDLTVPPKAWRMEQSSEGASPPWWKVNLWLLTSSILLSSTYPQAKDAGPFTPSIVEGHGGIQGKDQDDKRLSAEVG